MLVTIAPKFPTDRLIDDNISLKLIHRRKSKSSSANPSPANASGLLPFPPAKGLESNRHHSNRAMSQRKIVVKLDELFDNIPSETDLIEKGYFDKLREKVKLSEKIYGDKFEKYIDVLEIDKQTSMSKPSSDLKHAQELVDIIYSEKDKIRKPRSHSTQIPKRKLFKMKDSALDDIDPSDFFEDQKSKVPDTKLMLSSEPRKKKNSPSKIKFQSNFQ